MSESYKRCSKCGTDKSLNEFYSYKKYSKTKGEYVYYRPDCKECSKKSSTSWTNNNPEQRKSAYMRYDSKTDVKEKKKISNKKRVESGKYREWQRENPDKVRVYNFKRMHKTHDITKEEWESCKDYFNFECAYCGISEEDAKKKYNNYLHKDHANHEGLNDLSNCIPACKSCNGRKHTHNLYQWFYESEDIFNEIRLRKIIKWLSRDYVLHIRGKELQSQ